MLPVTDTGIALDAVTAAPSTEANRHEYNSPANRFATRNGSSAEYSAIMEKFGNSRNTISNEVRTGGFTQIIVVFAQIKVCTPDRLPVNRKLQGEAP